MIIECVSFWANDELETAIIMFTQYSKTSYGALATTIPE